MRVLQAQWADLLTDQESPQDTVRKVGGLKAEPHFCGLVANSYSLKTKKIPVGRGALGDGLGHYRVSTPRVGIFA